MPSKSDHESRRKFLKSLGILLGCQYLGTNVFAAQDTPAARAGNEGSAAGKYKIGAWTGDDFTLGHKLRAGEFPTFPEKAEKKVDFVIVGGGISGLTAAYNLKDQDFLLLEQYADMGGHSRGSSYEGIDYSYGAAYIGPVDGIYGELYSALSIEPVALPPDRNQFFFENEWYVGPNGDSKKPFYKEFDRFLKECEPIWKDLPEEPEPTKVPTGNMAKLDSTLFSSCLTGYSKEFISVINSFCRSSFGGGVNELSALAAYSLLQDLVSETHVFKGGNPAIGRALAKKVEAAGSQRCFKNAFVWKVEVKEGGASVVYSLADGSVHRVDCKHVIVATPPLVASRQLAHIPDMQKAQLFAFKYCSYLVANLLMKKKLFNGHYDCFVGDPFTLADITVAETPYMKTNTYKPEMGSVLTVYQPYSNGVEGRMLFMADNREETASNVVKQVEKLVPGFLSAIDEVVLTRWGHALAIIGPNYFSRLANIHKLQASNAYSLCHSSLYGWPAVECAITAGTTCAGRAKKLAANPGFVVQ